MLFELFTERTLADIDQHLRDSAARHQFGILGVHDLGETLRGKGLEFNKQVRVYEVCQPFHAQAVLEANGAMSAALPCRISVYEVEGGHRIATLLPTELLKGFEAPGVDTIAQEVEQSIIDMIRDAVGSLKTIDRESHIA